MKEIQKHNEQQLHNEKKNAGSTIKKDWKAPELSELQINSTESTPGQAGDGSFTPCMQGGAPCFS